ASRYAVKATPVYDQDGAGGNMGNPAYAEYFSDFTNGEGLNKDVTLGHPSLVLPIPSDQQLKVVDVSQYSYRPFNTTQKAQSSGSPSQYAESPAVPNLTVNGQQSRHDDGAMDSDDSLGNGGAILLRMTPHQFTPSPSSTSSYNANDYIYPTDDSELAFLQELMDPDFDRQAIESLTGECFKAAKANILRYYKSHVIPQIGDIIMTHMPPYEPTTVMQYELAANMNYFIFFMFVHPETKNLVVKHPYSDPAHQQVDRERFNQLVNTPQYFLTSGVVPLNRFHNTIAQALRKQTASINSSSPANGHSPNPGFFPPKNTLKH
ncbi:hypothetical protein H4R34_006117, partial [Dimargaris verticillata]